jgi:hypothetical protein
MDYQAAEDQIALLRQQGDQVVQGFKTLADKIQAQVGDSSLARELTLDLREAALAIQRQNQSASMLIEQMAQYIYSLENHVNAPQPGFQTRGWAAPVGPVGASAPMGGGFVNNLVTGLGLGAGIGLAEDVVNDIFRAF